MNPAALVVHVLLLSFGTTARSSSLSADLPANIWVQPALREAVAQLWQGSPTFRAQCRKIGAARGYLVHVMIDAAAITRPYHRAQCVMRVYTTGVVIARVTLPNHRQLTELIPHEFEHICERIDGVNLKRDAALHVPGIYEIGEGRIETDRAIQAGRQADAEMQTVTTLTRR
jgi:hypothetical protein